MVRLMAARIRVYIAASLDGFIAGPNDDLSWLPTDAKSDGDAVTFEGFMAEVGAMLMGRRTYDVVQSFGGPWPYGETPVLVATSRSLDPAAPSVRAIEGSIDALLDQALDEADGRDVYLDGGGMIRAALEVGRVDELIITYAPILLGNGIRLFDTLSTRRPLTFEGHASYGSMLQVRARLT